MPAAGGVIYIYDRSGLAGRKEMLELAAASSALPVSPKASLCTFAVCAVVRQSEVGLALHFRRLRCCQEEAKALWVTAQGAQGLHSHVLPICLRWASDWQDLLFV